MCFTGIVTRCPLELRMKNKPSGTPWNATISYNETGSGSVSRNIKQPSDVGEWIRDGRMQLVHCLEKIMHSPLYLLF
jgi:hypothetical protein